jgi:hypothetical protein
MGVERDMSSLIPALPVKLREADRPALIEHFIALDPEDRRLRFGTPLTDEALRAYVARIDFHHDRVFAVQDDRLRIVAAVHVARSGDSAELGLSVLPGFRGAHLGSVLFERAAVHLRNSGVATVQIHCLTENAAMMHIARKNGMHLTSGGSEADALLALARPTPQTYFVEWLQDRQADALHAVRQQARISRAFFGLPN